LIVRYFDLKVKKTEIKHNSLRMREKEKKQYPPKYLGGY